MKKTVKTKRLYLKPEFYKYGNIKKISLETGSAASYLKPPKPLA